MRRVALSLLVGCGSAELAGSDAAVAPDALVDSDTIVDSSNHDSSTNDAAIDDAATGDAAGRATDASVDAPSRTDATLTPDATADALIDGHINTSRIRSIEVTGPIELVWDWELYRDPEAQTFDNIPGVANTFDAPIHFFRNQTGELFTIASIPVNYRVPFEQSFTPARALRATDRIFDSSIDYPAPGQSSFHHVGHGDNMLGGSCVEADYDNRMWLFGVWTDDGRRFAALAHHEFYPLTCPHSSTAAWVNGVHHLTSTDGAANFLPQPYTPFRISGQSNARRLVLVPEPWAHAGAEGRATYGFFHPSNLVRDGQHIYALIQGRFYTGETVDGDGLHDGGMVMIRTRDAFSPSGWEVFTDDGWRAIAGGTFHGRRGQEVRLFGLQADYNPYATVPRGGQGLTRALLQHEETGQWIAFGVSHEGDGFPVRYMVTDSLSEPDWSETVAVEGAPPLISGNYPSLVDHESPDPVFQFISGQAYIYFVAKGDRPLVADVGALTPSNIFSRSIFRIPVVVNTESR